MVKLGKLFSEDQSKLIEKDDESEEEEEDEEDETPLGADVSLGINSFEVCTLCNGRGELISNIRCAAHTLQLAVEDALNKLKGSRNTLVKARTVAKALRTPTVRKQLRYMQPGAKKPKLDVVTRWHSTADMLESLLEVKDFCRKSSKTFTALELSEKQWQYIEDYLKSLMPAKFATKRLQDEQLTLGSFFGIWLECKCETQMVNTSLATELVTAMEKREEKLLENEALLAS
ncbi:uncharacterized protein LOC107047194, partial [Diachasma alloeum]|uniref:uncharacterized protein LOC107047194 n=1 Tax=Diachasma alloeum TaxID=454923 RepID=UPI000738364C